jgi:hypothetical protein
VRFGGLAHRADPGRPFAIRDGVDDAELAEKNGHAERPGALGGERDVSLDLADVFRRAPFHAQFRGLVLVPPRALMGEIARRVIVERSNHAGIVDALQRRQADAVAPAVAG